MPLGHIEAGVASRASDLLQCADCNDDPRVLSGGEAMGWRRQAQERKRLEASSMETITSRYIRFPNISSFKYKMCVSRASFREDVFV